MSDGLGVIIEVDWMLCESDGKLTYEGWRRVKRNPKQTMLVEVIDPEKGIQCDKFLRRCEHISMLMNNQRGSR